MTLRSDATVPFTLIGAVVQRGPGRGPACFIVAFIGPNQSLGAWHLLLYYTCQVWPATPTRSGPLILSCLSYDLVVLTFCLCVPMLFAPPSFHLLVFLYSFQSPLPFSFSPPSLPSPSFPCL